MKIKNILLLFITVLTISNVFGQYKLKITIDGLKNTDVYLAKYYGTKLYYYDTTKVDEKGVGIFERTELDAGLMALVIPGPNQKWFEIIWAEPEVELHTSEENFGKDVIVKKSKENSLFFDYQNFIKKQLESKKKFEQELKDAKTQNDKEKVNLKISKLDDEVIKKQNNLIENNKGLFISSLFNLNREPKVPDAPKDENGNIIDSLFQIKYYQRHYWDNMDFNDDRLVNAPAYKKRLDAYFNNWVIRHPDSIIRSAYKLIRKIPEGSKLFQYTVIQTTYKYETSKVMGMDKVFVFMVDEYYTTGKMDLDSSKLVEIRKKADGMRYTFIGDPAPNIILADTTGKKWINLKDINAKYTVLYFWDPTCGHCKKETPKLARFYDSIKEHFDIEVYAVCTKVDNDGWPEFINQHKLNWINVSDFQDTHDHPENYVHTGLTTLQSLNFRKYYDIYSTPRAFLLDKNKIIKAKYFDTDQLGDILNDLERIKP